MDRFLHDHPHAVEVRLTRVRGSAPREAGAAMLVAADATHGTIGGGQLEFMAIDEARKLLARGAAAARMDVSLGPEIGQCCGGRVEIALTRLDAAAKAALLAQAEADAAALPEVYVLGAGHVGRALAEMLALLPVRTILVDGRADELARATARVERRLSALPEAEVRDAAPGSAFVVLTHDHALDFLLTAEALARGDAAYVGMIGSATKRAKLVRYLDEVCGGQSARGLTCPIGAQGGHDKRPAVIAAFVAAEVMNKIATGAARMPAFQQG